MALATVITIPPLTIPAGSTTLPNPTQFPTGQAIADDATRISATLDITNLNGANNGNLLTFLLEVSFDGGVTWEPGGGFTRDSSAAGPRIALPNQVVFLASLNPGAGRRVRATASVLQALSTAGGTVQVQ